MSVQATSGTLLSSDIPTIVYLEVLDEKSGPRRFIIRKIDSTTLFIKNDPEILTFIRAKLAERLAETTYEEVDFADLVHADAS
jgi:hypothetical protein